MAGGPHETRSEWSCAVVVKLQIEYIDKVYLYYDLKNGKTQQSAKFLEPGNQAFWLATIRKNIYSIVADDWDMFLPNLDTQRYTNDCGLNSAATSWTIWQLLEKLIPPSRSVSYDQVWSKWHKPLLKPLCLSRTVLYAFTNIPAVKLYINIDFFL